MSDNQELSLLLFDLLRDKKMMMTAAESCTGGLISKIMTDYSGSSEVFWGSFVTYSNDAKMKILGVGESTLETHGAVSEEIVLSMAKGAIGVSGADCAVSVSGIAGPGGGSPGKPVGTVWICAALKKGVEKSEAFLFSGDRDDVRKKTAEAALNMLYHLILEN